MFIYKFITLLFPGFADDSGDGNGNLPKWLVIFPIVAFTYLAFEGLESSPSGTSSPGALETDPIEARDDVTIDPNPQTTIEPNLADVESPEIDDLDTNDSLLNNDPSLDDPLLDDPQTASTGEDLEFALIAGEFVNVRSIPSVNADLIDRVSNATVQVNARVEAQDEEWYLIVLPDGRQGFVYGEYVQPIQ
ncbi:MAG: SH3 domain-containing protein [Leptolyngbyaceae bacterium]|nr:SH3 domain-containing protein [Leptolyngbyaceae bacterium]